MNLGTSIPALDHQVTTTWAGGSPNSRTVRKEGGQPMGQGTPGGCSWAMNCRDRMQEPVQD